MDIFQFSNDDLPGLLAWIEGRTSTASVKGAARAL
jgi:hypothetical protein